MLREFLGAIGKKKIWAEFENSCAIFYLSGKFVSEFRHVQMKTSFQGLWLAFYCINAPFGQSGSHCNTSISVLNLIIRLCIVYTLLDELLENIFPPKLSSPKGIQWFMSGAVYLLVRVAMTWSAMKIWKYNAFKEFLKVTSITAAKWFSSLCMRCCLFKKLCGRSIPG